MATAKEIKDKRAQTAQEKNDVSLTLDLLKASGQYSEEQLNDIKSKLEASGPDSIIDELNSAVAALDATPEGAARKRDIMSQRKAERLSAKYQPFFQAIMAGGDIAASLGQIKQARRAAANLRPPAMPAVPGLDPALNQSIRDAQVGTFDAARIAGPARQELQDTYNKELALAKAIGGGQSATLGALGQVAAMRKNRGAASLIPLLDQARAREEGRLDNLVGRRGDLIDRNYRNQFYQFMSARDMYDKDAAAIGALGSAGRQNLRTGVQSLLGAVPGVAARIPMNGYGDKFSEYEASLNNSLTNQSQLPSPYSQLGEGRQGGMISDYWVKDPIIDQYSRMKYRPTLY